MELASSHSTSPIRILIIDDHLVVRAGLRLLLQINPAFLIVGEADSYSVALEVARREKPDVILLDLAIGKENGLDYIPDLLALSNQPRILVLTGVPDPVMHHRAVQLGALGLVLKSKAPGVLTEAIKKIHEGEAWLDRTMIANVITEMSRSNKEEKSHSEAARIASLTKREHDIISLVAKGFKNKQIADQLCISHITVRHHLTSIFSKLEVSDRFELIIYVFNNGLYDWPQQP